MPAEVKHSLVMDGSRLALAFALLAAGCTSGAGDPVPPLPGSGNFDESCPEGDTGVAAGNVLKGYVFEGYVDPSQGIGEARRKEINMCSFYNPTGDGVWGAGGAFEEGTPKPNVVMITLAAGWCGPCREEAAKILPGKYASYGPQGLEIVTVLADTLVAGESAGWSELETWVSIYDIEYVATVDPDREIANEFPGTGGFPINILVDSRTLRVVESLAGPPDAGFYQKLEQLLAE